MGRQNRQPRWLLTKVLWHYSGKMIVADGTNIVRWYILMIIIFIFGGICSIPKHFKEHYGTCPKTWYYYGICPKNLSTLCFCKFEEFNTNSLHKELDFLKKKFFFFIYNYEFQPMNIYNVQLNNIGLCYFII